MFVPSSNYYLVKFRIEKKSHHNRWAFFVLEKACHHLKIFAAHCDQLQHESLTGSTKIYVMVRTTEYTGLGISVLLSIPICHLCAVEN